MSADDEESLAEFTKYYDDFPRPEPESAVAEINFENMEIGDLVGLAQAADQKVPNLENDMLYVYAHYHIFLRTKRLENITQAIKKLDHSLNSVQSTSDQFDDGTRTLIVLLMKKFKQTQELLDLETAIYQAQDHLSKADRLDMDRYSRQSWVDDPIISVCGLDWRSRSFE